MKNVLYVIGGAGVSSLWWAVSLLETTEDARERLLVGALFASFLLLGCLTIEAWQDNKF